MGRAAGLNRPLGKDSRDRRHVRWRYRFRCARAGGDAREILGCNAGSRWRLAGQVHREVAHRPMRHVSPRRRKRGDLSQYADRVVSRRISDRSNRSTQMKTRPAAGRGSTAGRNDNDSPCRTWSASSNQAEHAPFGWPPAGTRSSRGGNGKTGRVTVAPGSGHRESKRRGVSSAGHCGKVAASLGKRPGVSGGSLPGAPPRG